MVNTVVTHLQLSGTGLQTGSSLRLALGYYLGFWDFLVSTCILPNYFLHNITVIRKQSWTFKLHGMWTTHRRANLPTVQVANTPS